MKNFKKNFVISFLVAALITGLYYVDLKHTEREQINAANLSNALRKEFGECADKSIIEIKTGNVSCQNQD